VERGSQAELEWSVTLNQPDGASPLDFHLDDAQRRLLANTAALAQDVLTPVARRGSEGRVNRELVKALASNGLLGLLFAGGFEPGDTGVSAMSLCLVREGLARACTEAETAFALQGLGAFPIVRAGSSTLVAEWIPAIAAGDAVAAFALSEPQAGSDVAALALRAERDGRGYRLTGEKTWISNAPEADIYSVFARTTEGLGARGLTAFAVRGDSEGLSGQPISLIAPHPVGTLAFDGVFVPQECVLGEPNQGFKVAMQTLELFRPSVGAFAVGIARTALDLAISHARDRQAFGRSLAQFQAVSHRLAELAARLQACRLLVHQAARVYDAGLHDAALPAMAKLQATELAQEVVDAAIQVHGAAGLVGSHPLEHLYREVRAPRIYEGASEIQREIIARWLFRAT
jgi:acyl-CoA dehydrogenase